MEKIQTLDYTNNTKKYGNIYITITNNVVNFKVRIPEEWLNEIGVNINERDIYISYDDKKEEISIEKVDKTLFSTLSVGEKVLQVKKCELEYWKKYANENEFEECESKKSKGKKEMIDYIAEYFNVTYRTVYRYINEETDVDIESVVLLETEKKLIRKSKVMFREGKNTNLATVTIPSALGFLLLQGKTKEELGVRNMMEIYTKNKVSPIWIELDRFKINIKNRADE